MPDEFPFKSPDEPAEEAEETEEVEEGEEAEEPEEGAEESDDAPDDEDDHELFDEEDGEGDDEDDLFESRKTPETIPYARFSKVIGERNALRSQVDTLKESVEAQRELTRAINEKYGTFDNPAKVLRDDADFMAAVEEMTKQDAVGVRQFTQQVLNYIKTGKVSMSNQNQEPAKPARDERVDTLIQTTAREKASAVLSGLGVKPGFQKIIADAVVSEAKDPAALDRDTIVAAARSFIKSNGFSAGEVLSESKRKEGTKKPPTGGKAAASEGAKKQANAKKADAPAAPKSLDEWQAQRDARVAELTKGLE